ncbi:MAG: hypothetical protein ABW217_21530, partial [Polyangiaceae bacterium]
VSGASGSSSCRVACSADDECSSENDGWTCSSASCVGSPALLSSSGPSAGARCPTFAAGVQEPLNVTTTFEPVPGSANVERAHADEGGVYWIELDGSVRGVLKGTNTTITYSDAPNPPSSRLGLMSDSTRLYWTEASAYPGGPLEPGLPPPPGRLMAVPKTGGTPERLVESETSVLTPVGVTPAGRTFVLSSESFLEEVTSAATLERVFNVPPLEGGGIQLVDSQVYWSSYDADTEQTVVYAATPGSGAPLRVTEVEGGTYYPFVAGRGVVLWTPGETRFDPLLLVQHFMMLNENTGCVQPLPSEDLSIGQILLDGRHVYWSSFNALGSGSPPGGLPSGPTWLRVNLATGRFERIVVAGVDGALTTDLIAQDATTLYLHPTNEGLYAVRKPE